MTKELRCKDCKALVSIIDDDLCQHVVPCACRETDLHALLAENKRLRKGCKIGEKLANAVAEIAPDTMDRFEVLTALGTIRAALAE